MKHQFFVLILSVCFLFSFAILHCTGTATYDLEARRNLSLEKYLQKGFQVIETNIPGKNIAEMLDKAEVILLLEEHSDKQRIINFELIQRERKEKDFLLLEEEVDSSALQKLPIDHVIQHQSEYSFLANKSSYLMSYVTNKELDAWDVMNELFAFSEFYFEKLLAWELEPELSAQELT
ncbi:MAG: hypothetical protein HYZ47_01830 [Simkania negevensis]|nr:hypothetical protein [Simkania negevensis]